MGTEKGAKPRPRRSLRLLAKTGPISEAQQERSWESVVEARNRGGRCGDVGDAGNMRGEGALWKEEAQEEGEVQGEMEKEEGEEEEEEMQEEGEEEEDEEFEGEEKIEEGEEGEEEEEKQEKKEEEEQRDEEEREEVAEEEGDKEEREEEEEVEEDIEKDEDEVEEETVEEEMWEDEEEEGEEEDEEGEENGEELEEEVVEEGMQEYEENEQEDDVEEQHEQLLSAIREMGRKRPLPQRTAVAPLASEYHLPQHKEGEQLSVEELLEGLDAKQGLGHLRKKLAAVQSKAKTLDPPLPKPQADRLQRSLAYDDTSKHVGKWVPIVKKNRPDHLSFPLQDEHPPLPSLTSRVEAFKPVTELECEVAAMLEGSSEHVGETEEGLTEAEKKALLQMSLKEAGERRRQLRRVRTLLSYQEQKSHRVKKIKSKKFHRALRRHREAQAAKAEEGGGASEDVVEKAERIRAKERMTLKHSTMARWAKKQLARGHKDPAAQVALSEHHQRRLQLKQRMQEEEEEESGSDDREGSESDRSEGEGEYGARRGAAKSAGGNPWLTSRPGKPLLLLDDTMASDRRLGTTPKRRRVDRRDNVEVVRTASGGSESLPTDFEPEDVNDGEESDEGREEEEEEEERAQKRKVKIVREVVSSGKATSREKKQPPKVELTGRKSALGHIDPGLFLQPEEGPGRRGRLGEASAHLLSVHEAFAGDDVVSEFARDKAEAVERGRPREVDLTLPGWGSWGGEGVRPRKKRVRVVRPAKPEKPRKDTHLPHVIINEERDTKAAKHQVSSLPWPYRSREQFEKTQSAPIGRNWNTEATFQHLVQPRVRTAVGQAIAPMTLTEDVEGFIKRTAAKRRTAGGGRVGRGGRGGGGRRKRKGAEKDGG